jgi:hypothetical protein
MKWERWIVGTMGRKHEKYRLKVNASVEDEIITSKALAHLTPTAMRVLMRFMQKRPWTYRKGEKQPTYTNTGLTFTYEEAELVFGIPESTFLVTIKRLVEVGFIDVAYIGGKHKHDFSRYDISDRWRDYGTPAFKVVEKKRVLQPGLDVRSWMKKKIRYRNL